MAKAHPLTGFTAALTVEDCLAQLIGFRLSEIEVCEEDVLKGTVDGVHDMRVSCRRLQAIFTSFRGAFQKKRVKKFRRTLRTLIKALGTVREYDVLIDHITTSVKPSDELGQTALGFLISRFSAQRKRAQKNLAAAVQDLDDTGALAAFHRDVGHLFSGKREAASSFKALLQQVVPRFCTDFLSSSTEVAGHPRKLEALHRLRIRGKPLRYVMELSEPCFGPAYRRHYQEIKAAIELLGDIHDLDVTIGTLGMYLEEVRLFNAAAKTSHEASVRPGFLLATVKTLRAKRAELFAALSSTLEQWRADRFAEKLTRAMQR